MRYIYIRRDHPAVPGALSDTHRAYSAAWTRLPLEERKRINSAADRSAVLRTTRPQLWRAYLEYFTEPGVHRAFYSADMAKVRLLMAEFGMSFPDLRPPAFPDPADHGIRDVYRSIRNAYPHPNERRPAEPSQEERRRVAEFGVALMNVASWHAKADTPGIPQHKLVLDASMNENCRGWIIRDSECAAALRIWRSLADRYGEAALMGRVGEEFEVELWSGWLVHLDGAVRHEGLHVVGSLNTQSVLHRLRRGSAGGPATGK